MDVEKRHDVEADVARFPTGELESRRYSQRPSGHVRERERDNLRFLCGAGRVQNESDRSSRSNVGRDGAIVGVARNENVWRSAALEPQ